MIPDRTDTENRHGSDELRRDTPRIRRVRASMKAPLPLLLIAIACVSVATPGATDVEPPGIGSKWIYRVRSGDRQTIWTRMIATELPFEGRACNVATSTDDGKMVRELADGARVRVIGGLLYWDREMLDVVGDVAFVEIEGRSLAMRRVRRFTDGRHGHPYRLGQEWGHEDTTTTTAENEVIRRVVKSYRTRVVAEEEVLGWRAFKIEYELVAVDGEPVEPALERTEWWSPEAKGEVRVVIHRARYATEEIRELESVDLR
jgi:hypothetical protein